MTSVGRQQRDDTEDVIVLDSDDDIPASGQAEAGPSSRRGPTAANKLAGSKRSRSGNAQTSRQGIPNSNVATDNDVVDLTNVRSRAPEPGARNGDVCIVGSDTSPAAKRRIIAVGKALQAHRKAGQQVAANMHNIQQAIEPREVESKPKCGICLDEMKEPACGSCGHVFCKPCLLSCLKATKKCPTCRRTLQPRTVHRIYLS